MSCSMLDGKSVSFNTCSMISERLLAVRHQGRMQRLTGVSSVPSERRDTRVSVYAFRNEAVYCMAGSKNELLRILHTLLGR